MLLAGIGLSLFGFANDIGDVNLGGICKKIVCDILQIPFTENNPMFQNSK